MDFQLPADITAKLSELDAFIDSDIKPLERENMQFFRPPARTRPHRLGQRRPAACRVA